MGYLVISPLRGPMVWRYLIVPFNLSVRRFMDATYHTPRQGVPGIVAACVHDLVRARVDFRQQVYYKFVGIVCIYFAGVCAKAHSITLAIKSQQNMLAISLTVWVIKRGSWRRRTGVYLKHSAGCVTLTRIFGVAGSA